ncbi:unnamed protein product [Clonostachys chloroleuca]|uniref:DUF6546 domain-containing protein n=1 Tax=Clonostachys chloroleuca TaxID=1926264 RepID=A0AA35LRX8_9HYPO|nr:unnamed protein product [Clonostachys chloroleuca]
MSWQKLPKELQLQILEEVANSDDHRNLPRLARVCRDWQNFFEFLIYKHVVLDEDVLHAFEATVAANRAKLAAVEAVTFRIKLPEYQYPQCLGPEDVDTTISNNQAFTYQVLGLLDMLSGWHEIKSKGITLGLAVFTPSDNEHRFFFCEEEEDYPFQFEGDLQRSPNLLEYYQRNIWKSTRYICPSEYHYDLPNEIEEETRVCGEPLVFVREGEFIPYLPRVPIVEHFSIRRQRFRSIGVCTVALIAFRCLTNVRSLRFERRAAQDVTLDISERQSQAESLILALGLHRSIRQLSFTEWTSFHSTLDFGWKPSMLRNAGIARVFQYLTDFATNCTGTVDHILAEMTTPGMCQSLERLSLAPQSFNRKSSSQHAMMDTIERSTEILPACPNLRVMELWGVKDGDGRIFRYKMDRGARRASITWSTCRSDIPFLNRVVVKSWVDATTNIGAHPLAICTENIDETELAMQINHGQPLLKYLELRHLLMHPLTLAEINAEDELMRIRGRRRLPRSNIEQ